MYLFLIYNDPAQKHLCAWYKVNYIKDIICFTNRLFRYSDISDKPRIYRTYKTHFKVIEIDNTDRNKYFTSINNASPYCRQDNDCSSSH